MKFFGTTSFIALVSLAGPTFALDIGGGFSLTGKLEYEHMSSNGSDQSFGLLNADLSYESASGFGGFIGVQAISAGSSAEALYGALSYSGDFGKIQIGAPRGALNDYVSSPMIAGLDFFDLQAGMFSGSVLPVLFLESGQSQIGVRYDGSFGAANVGLSYHDLDGGQVIDAAMTYSFGDTVVKAGTELVRDSGSTRNSVFIGAEHDFGQVTAGGIVGSSDFFGPTLRTVKLYAVYSPTDRLDLTATVLNIDSSGPNGTFYGIAANYDLTNGIFVEAGYMGSSGSGFGTDIAGLSVGVKF